MQQAVVDCEANARTGLGRKIGAGKPGSLRRSAWLAWMSAVLCVVLCSCGDSDAPASEGTSADASTGQPDLGVVPDTEADVAPDAQPDAPSLEVASPDGADSAAGDIAPSCPGGPGCACTSGQNCDSGQCIQVPEGYKCAQPCVSGCPNGYSCKLIGSADPQSYCLPNFLSLCAPCKTNSDCATTGIDALCLDYGTLGSYCGSPCSADVDCPADYACVDTTAGGKVSKQCKLKPKVSPGSGAACPANPCPSGESCLDGTCQVVQQGQCGCSQWAVQYGKSTECNNTNTFGSCKAERKCSVDGLTACVAKTPAAEQCNLKDDDCDGATDNLAPDFVCYKTAFLGGGSGATCKGDGDCTTPGEACDTTGVCHPLIGKCPGKPTCAANGALICNDSKTPKQELCNGEDDDCDNLIDEDFTWPVPTGGVVDIGKPCGLGPCGGGKVVCKSLNEAICTTDVKASKEVCDGQDNDCNGQTDDAACEDKNACTTDTCEPSSGKCNNALSVNCDDSNVCTIDACNPKDGICSHEIGAASCDDGNKCTVGDTCVVDAAGLPQCTTGTAMANCDDANPCTDDSCAPDKGCVHLANDVTQACYSGAATTQGVGTCVGGVRYCKNGVLGAACEGEVVPSAKEGCDGLDDTCNGATDENCSAVAVQLSYTAGSLDFAPTGGTRATFAMGSSFAGHAAVSPTGGTNALVGFIAWLGGLFK